MMKCFGWLMVMVLAACVCTGRVQAQAVPAAPGTAATPDVDIPIPLNLKTAADVTTSADVITAAIKARFDKLADNTKPDDQSKARIWLIGQIAHEHGQADPSASFKNAYSDVVNQQCVALLAAQSSMRVRTNIGIIAAKVIVYTHNANLYPTVTKLLADKCNGVVLWGILAAGDLWPAVYDSNAINAGQKAAFLETVVKAGVALGTAGHEIAPEIIESVYKALDTTPTVDVNARKLLIAANLEVLTSRAAQYQDGKHPVLDPEAEGNGFASVMIPGDWHDKVLSDAQKTQAGQLAGDIMALAAAGSAGRISKPTAACCVASRLFPPNSNCSTAWNGKTRRWTICSRRSRR